MFLISAADPSKSVQLIRQREKHALQLDDRLKNMAVKVQGTYYTS